METTPKYVGGLQVVQTSAMYEVQAQEFIFVDTHLYTVVFNSSCGLTFIQWSEVK